MAEVASTGLYKTVKERIPDDPEAFAAWLRKTLEETSIESQLEGARELAKHILALEKAGTLAHELAGITLPRQEAAIRPIAAAMADTARDVLKAADRLSDALGGKLPASYLAKAAFGFGRLVERLLVRHGEPWAQYGRKNVSQLRAASQAERAQAKKREAMRLYDELRPRCRTREATYPPIAETLGCKPRTVRKYLSGHHLKDEKNSEKKPATP